MPTMIAAMTKNHIIASNGVIPWRYPEDLKRFRQLTMGGVVIMGRVTWDTLPGPLDGRDNLVVTHSPKLIKPAPGVRVTSISRSFKQDVLELAMDEYPGKLIWIIGGRQIYSLAMPYVHHIDITYVPDKVPIEGATFFPTIPTSFHVVEERISPTSALKYKLLSNEYIPSKPCPPGFF